MGANFKAKTYRNRGYLDFVRKLPCIITGDLCSEAAHIKKKGLGGMGLKVSDLRAIPMRHDVHMASHNTTWENFCRHYNLDERTARMKCLVGYIMEMEKTFDEPMDAILRTLEFYIESKEPMD